MNKREVDKKIPDAYKVLNDVKIVKDKDEKGIVIDGKIKRGWRGQIASFGAAVAMGSLLSAVSFFSSQGSAELPRELLIKALESLIKKDNLHEYIMDSMKEKPSHEHIVKEEIMNATIALKLAMNLYDME